MAMICMKDGGTFFGDIIDYDWKDKFLVVKVNIGNVSDKKNVHWDNIISVVTEIEEEMKEEDAN